ncbi:hypothetical protein EUTSA_v10003759mg [Eutrema salsugineum]|uniref:Protein kinase domain-containing protein n=1 Tax=Eutrema salsugineum TaxID=72664 RepID=V4K0C7_EUTSA|nr:L-type lectin-domain containing receptor kinase IX.2 [Eutrema salsugineum]ESQ31295.1 hypothetical protein EUTSA_v10003759mg [Eutrema salsugineum]
MILGHLFSYLSSSFSMACSILFFSFFLLLPFVVDSLYFKFTSFRPGDAGNIVYHGDATPDENGTVNFNNAARTSQVGWITYSKKVPLWSPRTGKTSDFNTSFSFKIDARNLSADGHGICFFLAPMGAQLPAYSVGGFLGMFTREDIYKSSFPLVHVEFDTFNDPDWDPGNVGSHVGINNNSLVSSNYTSWNASAHSQDIGHAHISYDSVAKNLSVTWSYELTASADPKENSSLSYIIDLAKVLPSEVMLGFIAAAGTNTEEHRLLSWELSSSLESEKANNRIGLVVGISVSGCVFLTFLVITTVVVWSRKQRKRKAREMTNMISINEDLERETGPRKFSYKDLVSATNGFSQLRKLGEGGFGAVYSGNLKEINMRVAVKKLSGGSRQGKKEFLNEVKVISKLRHRNLVQLIGWCNEENEFLLIYELMPNGSLNSHLFGKRPQILSWDTRYKIARGLASALLYLHEEWDQCVLHRDIKASNIMLDSDFNAKLGDFGLARVMNHKLDSHKTGLAGTFGYMAPEYVMTGSASKESDIYSFGIVLLEIVTGRKSLERTKEEEEEENSDTESDEKSLVEKVWELYGKQEETLISCVDEKLGEDFNREEAQRLLVLGLGCGHPDKNSRPSIKQAIQVLSFESPLPDNLPLKRPVATYYTSSSSSPSVNSSGASITFTSHEFGR